MLNNISRIKDANETNELMGIEGRCAKNYFSCFSYILKDYEFEKRTRRPARDEVNALLNLGYAFLNNEVNTRLSIYSFDLELGFLHGIRYGRKSLSLDLMEEFRPCFIDRFTFMLLNKKIISEKDFTDSEDEGYKLKPSALKKYCEHYHEYLINEEWKRVFDKQINTFRNAILKGKNYIPWRYL